MHRFFVSPGSLAGEVVFLEGELAHRLGRVLRLRPGDRVVLLDDTGWEYEAELTRLGPDRVEARLVNRALTRGEPATRIHLYQGLLKATKLEAVLQKGTELGLASFTPVRCLRCVAGAPSVARQGRWRRLVQEAAEQSRRGRLPPVHPLLSLEEALATAPGLRLLPWEGEPVQGLRQALSEAAPGSEVSLFIGPEGGWAEEEVALAGAQGVVPVGLGPRILRAETAGLVAAAAILYHCGELGG